MLNRLELYSEIKEDEETEVLDTSANEITKPVQVI